MPQTRAELKTARSDCLGMILKSAGITAGGSLLPPGFGAGVDAGVLMDLLPAINAKFGLAYEQIETYGQQEKQMVRRFIKEQACPVVGQRLTKETIFQILKQAGVQVTAKELFKFIPGIGQVIAAGISYAVLQEIGKSHLGNCYTIALAALEMRLEGKKSNSGSDREDPPPVKSAPIKDESYYGRILGLSGKLTKTEIKKRYRDLVSKYHPDKVHHLGQEFQDMAQEKAKEINEAYDFFTARYDL
jgi:hypothetical protein